MVFDFSLSTSAYRGLLEKEGIALGDAEKDPLMIFKKEMIEEYRKHKDLADDDKIELNDIKVHIGWPFFSILLKCK